MDKQLKMLIRNSKFQSVQRLQREVAKIITSSGYGAKVWDDFEPKGLYRARKHAHLEGTIKNGDFHPFIYDFEFYSNKPENCSLGRCNDDRESMFYCTNEFEVAIQEVKPETNDRYITVANFIPKPKEVKTSLGRTIPIGVEYLSRLPGLQKFFTTENLAPNNFKQLDNFLNALFYINVTEKNKHLYKLSTAVAKNMMISIREGNKDVPMQGLVYSSMARDMAGFNIVFKPKHVISNYYLYAIQTLEIIENNNEFISLELVRNGHPETVKNHIDESSKISWYDPIDNGEIHTFQKRGLISNISL